MTPRGIKPDARNRGCLAGYDHYDSKGNKTGHSEPGLFGGYDHYDAKGNKIGSSDPGLFGSYSNGDADACYIATCVYGSYDTPEVWMLRRFRDGCLANHGWGRAFIRLYYRISPELVARFGEKQGFHSFWIGKLNRFVSCLQSMVIRQRPMRI